LSATRKSPKKRVCRRLSGGTHFALAALRSNSRRKNEGLPQRLGCNVCVRGSCFISFGLIFDLVYFLKYENMNTDYSSNFQALGLLAGRVFKTISFAVGGYWCLYFIGFIEAWAFYYYMGAAWVIDLFPVNRYITYSMLIVTVSGLAVVFSVFVIDKKKTQIIARLLLSAILLFFVFYLLCSFYKIFKIDQNLDGILGVSCSISFAFVGGFFVGDIVKNLRADGVFLSAGGFSDIACVVVTVFLFAPFLMGVSWAKLTQINLIKKPNVYLEGQAESDKWRLLEVTPSGAVLFIPNLDVKQNVFRIIDYSEVFVVNSVNK